MHSRTGFGIGLLLTFATSIAASAQEIIRPSVEIATNRVVWLDRAMRPTEKEVVTVLTTGMRKSDVRNVFLRVSVAGVPIQNLVSIPRRRPFMSRTTPFDTLGVEEATLSTERVDVFELDLTRVALPPGQRIDYQAIVVGARHSLQAFSNAATDTEVEPIDEACVKACIQAYVNAIGVTCAEGKVKLPSPLDEATMDAAEDALRDCLEDCVPSVDQLLNKDYVLTVDGKPFKIRISIARDGLAGASGTDATATGSADLVVAIGGDPGPIAIGSSNRSGGDAKATNSKPGGGTIAIGGDGIGGMGVSGDGGKGHANSTASSGVKGGDSAAIGGLGGAGDTDGGEGGEGKAKTTCPNATANGKGGTGGPVTGPNKGMLEGGKGGNGSAQNSPTAGVGYGAGQNGGHPIGPGQHGTGGTATANTSGTAGVRGVAVSN